MYNWILLSHTWMCNIIFLSFRYYSHRCHFRLSIFFFIFLRLKFGSHENVHFMYYLLYRLGIFLASADCLWKSGSNKWLLICTMYDARLYICKWKRKETESLFRCALFQYIVREKWHICKSLNLLTSKSTPPWNRWNQINVIQLLFSMLRKYLECLRGDFWLNNHISRTSAFNARNQIRKEIFFFPVFSISIYSME